LLLRISEIFIAAIFENIIGDILGNKKALKVFRLKGLRGGGVVLGFTQVYFEGKGFVSDVIIQSKQALWIMIFIGF
jgi:hypothetical protein